MAVWILQQCVPLIAGSLCDHVETFSDTCGPEAFRVAPYFAQKKSVGLELGFSW